MERDINDTHIKDVMNESDWNKFREVFSDNIKRHSDILGALAVGSLIHPPVTPLSFYEKRRPGKLGAAYESIRNPERRKPAPCPKSDLDIWLCVRDTHFSEAANQKVNRAGMALLEELASRTLERGTLHWSKKKKAVFGDFYKNPSCYSEAFKSMNPQQPWLASEFKNDLEKNLIENIPDLQNKIRAKFQKSVPGDFLEIRAFPESLFHLRPDDIVTPEGFFDREPFPRIADDQWISTEHSSIILYSSSDISIYPFKKNGVILGDSIDNHIKTQDTLNENSSYGCILLKPDAIMNNQVNIIRQKIIDGITKVGGSIIIEKSIDKLEHDDVEKMYPILRGEDLTDAKEYLSSGSVIAFLIKAPISQLDMFKLLSLIKGPRLSDRSNSRLAEGRIEYGAIRDLLPLPGDEKLYQDLISTIIKKQHDPSVRFSKDQYKYYSRNLAHSPDNSVELQGMIEATGINYSP